MKRPHLLNTDWLALTVLAGMALLVYGEAYRRGVDLGTLGLGVAALGLFLMLGSPWQFQPAREASNYPALALAAFGLVVGLVSDLLLPISIAWSALLWAWLSCRLPEEARARVRRLLLLTLLIFPWADLDIKPVHWAMRLSAAVVAQYTLSGVGLPTTRQGTMLYVAGQPVEISEQCAGGETLHAMLVIGLASAFVYLDRRQAIAPWLPLLCGFAWLANTLRVLLIAIAAVYWLDSPYFTWVHDAGGWLVVAFMLVFCMSLFSARNRWLRTSGGERPSRRAAPRGGRDGGQVRHEGALARAALWSLLAACVLLGSLWRMVPLPDAQDRLQQLSGPDGAPRGRELALSESEVRRLGGARAVKRAYRLGGREFVVTVIDGTRNRRAVHDPMYCWTITEATEFPLPGGNGAVLRVIEEGFEKEVLFWFSDGTAKHASPARYWLQTSWRRATLGRLGAEPLLVLVEPLDSASVNWFRLLDSVPWLMDL